MHSKLLFLLAFNRDEFFVRPTHPVYEWDDLEGIVAPRDLVRNGTWLGMAKNGKIGFLTNYRVACPPSGKKSRGDIIPQFLTGTEKPSSFLQGLKMEEYGLLNLVVANLHDDIQVGFRSSAPGSGIELLAPGIHGFSNGRKKDKTWHKVEKAKTELKNLISNLAEDDVLPWNEIFEDIMGSSQECEAGLALPQTGVGEWTERRFSAMHVAPFWNFARPVGLYGTRSQIVVALWSNGLVEVKERVWNAEQQSYEHGYDFYLEQRDISIER